MKSCLAKDFFVCIFAAAMESIHHFWTVNVGTNTYSYDGYWNSKFIWKVLAYWRKIICEIFIDWNFIGSSKSSFWYKVWTLLFLLVLWSICFGLKKKVVLISTHLQKYILVRVCTGTLNLLFHDRKISILLNPIQNN